MGLQMSEWTKSRRLDSLDALVECFPVVYAIWDEELLREIMSYFFSCSKPYKALVFSISTIGNRRQMYTTNMVIQ